ncbi:unnamed protein product [Prunus armeniaca]
MGNSSSDEPVEENPPNFNEGRNRRPPVWMEDYETGKGLSEEDYVAHFVMLAVADPVHFKDARKKIGVKWVYKTKLNENGEVDKYKARLVAKGYSQQHGIDYTEVFAHVARLDTIHLVIALAAQRQWTIYQLDVKSAFLHGELNEEVFVEQPQTAKEGIILILSLYVDDLIFTGNDESMFVEFKRSMMLEFDMTDLGKIRYFLGIEVMQRTDGIFISQKKYALEVLEKFGMNKSNPVLNPIVPGCKLLRDEDGVKVDSTIYKQIVGSLMYLTATRPYMMFVVSLIIRNMSNPTELHMEAAKRILRYLRGTTDFGVFYKKGGKGELNVYTDSDYAADQKDRKSSSGYVFLFSSEAVSWSSKKQPIVTLSTTEAEFITTASCACQVVWLRRIFEMLGEKQDRPTIVHCDSSSAIKLAKNPVMRGCSC